MYSIYMLKYQQREWLFGYVWYREAESSGTYSAVPEPQFTWRDSTVVASVDEVCREGYLVYTETWWYDYSSLAFLE